MTFCLDTCFLIDLQRERKRGPGPAANFLAGDSKTKLWVSAVAWGEFAEGRLPANQEVIAKIRKALLVAPITEEIAEIYARISSGLRSQGRLIEVNDLWIAATAISLNLELVTKNTIDFQRIPDLRIKIY